MLLLFVGIALLLFSLMKRQVIYYFVASFQLAKLLQLRLPDDGMLAMVCIQHPRCLWDLLRKEASIVRPGKDDIMLPVA